LTIDENQQKRKQNMRQQNNNLKQISRFSTSQHLFGLSREHQENILFPIMSRQRDRKRFAYPSCEAERIPKSDITARPRTVSGNSFDYECMEGNSPTAANL